MAVTKITFENKTGIQNDASVARKNKVVDEDMNEIKQVVNNNADEVSEIQENIEDLQGGQGTADADITSLKNRVNTLETDNTQNKSDINILKNDNETNKSNISTLQENVSDLETNKVSKVDGMGLSEENFTTGLKNKLKGLNNYDDTELQEKVSALESDNETNKFNIEELQEDNIQNKTDITDIKEEQETQNLYIENLQTNDSKQDELISKLKSAALNTETEEAKSIHVEDASTIGQLEVFGNQEQETRSGKNRFKLPDSGNNNGIIYTNNGDGTFNISGTAQEQASFSIVVPLENSGFEQGKNYTISSNVEIGNIKYYVHSCTASGAWNKTLLDFVNETSKTKEMPAPSTDYISLNIVVFKDVTVNYQNVTVQIEEGTVATEYEQYGASPSPDYPSKIVCLGSNKNEFNIENTRTLNNTVLDSVDENSIIFTNNGLGVNRQVFIECYLEKGTYTIQRKFEILEGTGIESSGAVALYQANTWKQSLMTATDKIKTFTITESNTYRIRLSINDSNTMTENIKIKFYNIKIEEGTEATSYSPIRTR